MFLVTYSDERGNQARRTFEREDNAIAAFLDYLGDTDPATVTGEDYGFPTSDAWDFIGWVSETTALYGFSNNLPFIEDFGNATVSITHTREHAAGCRCHASNINY